MVKDGLFIATAPLSDTYNYRFLSVIGDSWDLSLLLKNRTSHIFIALEYNAYGSLNGL